MFTRKLDMTLPKKQSAFLWGARKTGKSSYLHSHYPQSLYFDFLDTQRFMQFTRAPYTFREEVLAQEPSLLEQPIIIDEVQKIPDVLNEVHWLIENANAQFILCGSSARQLKTQSTNLLGGRAWIYHFYPLIFPEIPKFDLLKAMQRGLIPDNYVSEDDVIQNNLQAYVDVYLTDEIRNEGLVRNLAGFARFLDVAGLSNGDMINFNNIARDCGVERETVQNYYQILIDTMLGYFIYPYNKKIKRDIIMSVPKFYLFDIGIANYLSRQIITDLKGAAAGKCFEHYILMELIAYKSFMRKRFDICYWRTKTGLEVDFVLGNAEIAIEIKISNQVHLSDLKGLVAFCEEHKKAKAIVVSQDVKPRKLLEPIEIDILPWQLFLEKLWNNEFTI